jgi:endoglucanase
MFFCLAQPKTYSIRAVANEKYLSVPFNSELLKANKHKIGHFDKFEIIVHSDGSISFKSLANEKYISIEDDNSLLANSIENSEKFYLITNRDFSISFKSIKNLQYLSINNENLQIVASKDEIQITEKFNIITNTDG